MSATAASRVQLPFEPYEHQKEAHAKRLLFRFMVLVWHRGAGKTVWAVVELVLAAAVAEAGARFGYIAPLRTQAKDVVWDYLKTFLRGIPGVVFNEAELSARLPNDVLIRLYGADNPDALRGIHFDGIVGDEVKDWKPEVWGEILRPALARRNGWAVFIGTPKGANLFQEIFYAALRNAEWFADLKTVYDTGVLPPEEIEKAKREMRPAQFAAEMLCDFAAAADDVLIPLPLAVAAQRRVITEAAFLGSPRVLGVDVARHGDDRSVLFPRQGVAAFKFRALRTDDLMVLAGHVAEFCDKWKPDAVFLDEGGMGYGVKDRLTQLGYDVTGINFAAKPVNPKHENKRAEMWCDMAEWLRVGCIPDDPELLADLTSVTYDYANAAGKIQIDSKHEMRAKGRPSPDLADALALTFAAPVIAADPLSVVPGHREHSARGRTSWDPFAFDDERRA